MKNLKDSDLVPYVKSWQDLRVKRLQLIADAQKVDAEIAATQSIVTGMATLLYGDPRVGNAPDQDGTEDNARIRNVLEAIHREASGVKG